MSIRKAPAATAIPADSEDLEGRWQAVERERTRLARGLHDGLAQSLTGVALAMRMLYDDSASARQNGLGERLHEVLAEIESCVKHVRAMSRALDPSRMLQGGLGPAFMEFVEALSPRDRARIDVTIGTERSSLPAADAYRFFTLGGALVESMLERYPASRLGVSFQHERAGRKLAVEAIGDEKPQPKTPGTDLAGSAALIGARVVARGRVCSLSLPEKRSTA